MPEVVPDYFYDQNVSDDNVPIQVVPDEYVSVQAAPDLYDSVELFLMTEYPRGICFC
jgi:hypothetical protein